ncbi:hypothetical protein FNAPI_10197 [Fusarium napiforme]|uniref:Uncharacterized protein n=1 Tax=Fusarium napiforme TaxID=42672 RepID=A0A8H5MUC1_9HYPO|nr:hypothetical protein FNAPI_10197 [Fusarium napiforme]
MSDIPRINSSSKRKKSEGHEVMQNPEASNFGILETTENIDDVSGAAKNNGNSIDNDSPPAKKKCTSKNPIPIKGRPRWTPCVTCISRMVDKGYKYICYSQRLSSSLACYDCARHHGSCKDPVGETAVLRRRLQNYARLIVVSQRAVDEATQRILARGGQNINNPINLNL